MQLLVHQKVARSGSGAESVLGASAGPKSRAIPKKGRADTGSILSVGPEQLPCKEGAADSGAPLSRTGLLGGVTGGS